MQRNSTRVPPRLVWIFPVFIFNVFNAATYLETTKELRKLGWKVDLLVAGPAGKQMVYGVEVICFPVPDVYLVRYLIFHFWAIVHILRHWRSISVVYFEQPSALWVLPLRLLRPLSRKHPIFVMDTRTVPMQLMEKASWKFKLRKRLFSPMNRLAKQFADGQTAITKQMADLLCIPREMLWGTWSSGVNLERFSIALRNRRWPDLDDNVRIIYVGTLNYERNLLPLCQAVVEANRQGMNFILLLYGEGTEKEELKTFALQTNKVVQIYDTIPHDQMPEILAHAHLGALPFPDEDKYKVCSPIKLFEYMGAGMPILATKIVCHTDVIGNGEYVFWAENANVDGLLEALQKVWNTRLNLSGLGEKALTAAGNWTWSASAKRLNDALHYGLSLSRDRGIRHFGGQEC